MTRAKDREDASGNASGSGFDDLWGKLVDAASDSDGDRGADTGDGATKAWTDDVRGEGARPPKESDEGVGSPTAVPVETDRTQSWTEDVRANAKSKAVGTSSSTAAGEQRDDAPSPSASVSAARSGIFGPAPGNPDLDVDAEMAKLMKVPIAAPAKADDPAQDSGSSAADESGKHQASDERESSAARLTSAAASGTASVRPREDAVVSLAADDEEHATLDDEPSAKKPWWILGVAAVGLGAYVMLSSGGDEVSPEQPTVAASDPANPAAPAQPGRDTAPPPAHTPARSKADSATPAAGVLPSRKGPTDAATPTNENPAGGAPTSSDPREPPPGTPEDIAAVFRRLPVSPADKPPVGGVGVTGIHVDDISMGSTIARRRCQGGESGYSISAGDEVNVCLRVVHLRQKEELTLLWQRDGGTRRRGKVVVKPAHAYRTRAYLKLRDEDAGQWTVRVMAGDIELASHEFVVLP